VTLQYTPPAGGIVPGPHAITVQAFRDVREEGANGRDHYLGVIKTPVGTPLQYFSTDVPVAQEVANGFRAGLHARDMLSRNGTDNFTLTGDVEELHCEQVVRPSATARIKISLRDKNSGTTVFTHSYEASENRLPSTKAGDALLNLTSKVLTKVIDRVLDDPEFRNALDRPKPSLW
jgi:hypothetical protein